MAYVTSLLYLQNALTFVGSFYLIILLLFLFLILGMSDKSVRQLLTRVYSKDIDSNMKSNFKSKSHNIYHITLHVSP